MKVGIICFWDRVATPYIDKYENILDNLKIDFDVLLWNRSNINIANTGVNDLYINVKAHRYLLIRILDFYKWKARVLSQLKTNKYDKLIVLSTVPAFLLRRYLRKNYKKKYIFDIRDYTFEKNYFFSKVIHRIVHNSYITTISSEGFYEWLRPAENVVINHNITFKQELFLSSPSFNRGIINFGFVGNVRLDRQTRIVLLKLKDSNKYLSSFTGRIMPNSDIEDFIGKNKISNVIFSGEFHKEDKPKIYADIDLINAVYANTNNRKKYSDSTPLPNRIYDCVIYKRPIVASKNTYLSEIVDKFNLGFSINGFEDNVIDEFDKYIRDFEADVFISGCNTFLKKILEEEDNFIKQVVMFLRNMEVSK